MSNSTSRQGVLFIANREALVLTAYPDGPHVSVGFGHQAPEMKAGDQITVRHAFDLLKADIAAREPGLNKMLKVPVSQQQFDALMSLHYQSGNRYVPKLAAAINAGDVDAAAAMLPDCDRNLAGVESAGLRKRRLLEQGIFAHGEYGSLDPLPYWPDNPRTTRMQQYHLQPGDL